MNVPTRRIIRGLFDKPTLEAGGNGKATWSRSLAPGTNRVAWAAKLDGGMQDGWNDYAKVIVPVNEMFFTDLKIVRLLPKYTASSGQDMAVTVYMHDPNDIEQHIELSHTPYTNTAAGYRELNFPTEPGGVSWFWYGNVTDTPDTCPTEGTTSYTWAQFQADSVFSTWTIYRISLDNGYGDSDVVQNDCYLCQALINNVSILLEPSLEEQIDSVIDGDAIRALPAWTFGKPTLTAQGHGKVDWQRGTAVLSTHQKGGTGWVARLYGGEQTAYDDAAQVFIPVNEMSMGDLSSVLWSYFLTNTEVIGVNMVVWAHDPDDFDKRVEITMEPHTQMEVASGWNAHEHATTDSFTFGGEGVSGNTVCTTAYTAYTWAQFMSDPFFSRLTIYRISFDWGFWAEGHLEYAYLGDVSINGTIIPMKPSVEEQLDLVRDDVSKALTTIPTWTFGKPTLRASNHGRASWSRWQYQKGATAWNACLEGGVQSGDDWAAMFVPVNEMPLNELKTAAWSYNKSDSDQSGVALEIWAHDPNDFSKRAEIGQTMAEVGTTAGWHSEELDTSLSEFKWWGESVTDADSAAPGTCTTTNTNYTWAQYMSDSVFSTWTIYRIEFVIGWIGSGTLTNAYLAEVEINGTIIPLGTSPGGRIKTVVATKLMTTATHTADEIIAESVGVDWDFAVGGNGVITKATVTHDSVAAGQRLSLLLFTNPPSGATDDEAANDNPTTADTPYYVGRIDFPAMVANGTGDPSSIVTPSTVGNLPIFYDSVALYGILIAIDEYITVAEVLTITLTVELEEN